MGRGEDIGSQAGELLEMGPRSYSWPIGLFGDEVQVFRNAHYVMWMHSESGRGAFTVNVGQALS